MSKSIPKAIKKEQSDQVVEFKSRKRAAERPHLVDDSQKVCDVLFYF